MVRGVDEIAASDLGVTQIHCKNRFQFFNIRVINELNCTKQKRPCETTKWYGVDLVKTFCRCYYFAMNCCVHSFQIFVQFRRKIPDMHGIIYCL